MTVLEAFWPWDLTGVGWVGLADAFNVERRFRGRNSARWVCVKTMISERVHKLVSVLEAFWLGTLPVLAGSVWQML